MLPSVRASLCTLLVIGLAASSCTRRPEASAPDAARAAPQAPPDESDAARPKSAQPPLAPGEVPRDGCVVAHEQAIPGYAGGVAAYLGETPAVLALSAEGQRLSLWEQAEEGRFYETAQRVLDAGVVQAAVRCARECELALVDAHGNLSVVAVGHRSLGSARLLARDADRRFAPALARAGESALIAYTASAQAGGGMRVRLVSRRAGASRGERDLTPPGHGGASPVFVLGAEPPVLVFLDARAGVSPLLEVPFDEAGTPGELRVRTPVSQPYAPPLLVALAWPSGEVEVFYSAIGRLARTAVGRVPLRQSAEPRPLLPSQGYGPLAFSAARSGRGALVALERPVTAQPGAPRALVLKLLREGSEHDVAAPSRGGAGSRSPSVAAGEVPGAYLLAYRSLGALQVALLRCDDE